MQTPSVVSVVGNNRPESLPDYEIEAIRSFLGAKIEFDPYPYLIEGSEVEVCRGPLRGLRGLLCSKKNKHRLIININLINNSVATEIDAEDVIPV